MPRAQKGPRQIDKTGTWYAIRMVSGRRGYRSLQTTSYSEAMRRWPAAMAELEEELRPVKPKKGEVYQVWHVPSGMEPSIENLDRYGSPVEAKAESVFSPEELEEASEVLTWSDAIEVAKARHRRRKTREMSKSHLTAIHQGLKYTKLQPLEITVKEVRQMIKRMEGMGHQPQTIQQRISALSTVIESLIKGGETDDIEGYSNPFKKVDTAAKSDNHHHTAEPDDYWVLHERGQDSLDERSLPGLLVLMYSGCRLSEMLHADYNSEPGWMLIQPRGAWLPKTKTSYRVVPLPSWLSKMDLGAIYPLLTENRFRHRFNKARGGRAHITPHSFRHGFKTAARLAGADELTIETVLGHSAGSAMSRTYGQYPRELLLREAQKVWKVLDEWTGRLRPGSGRI